MEGPATVQGRRQMSASTSSAAEEVVLTGRGGAGSAGMAAGGPRAADRPVAGVWSNRDIDGTFMHTEPIHSHR